MRKIYYLTLDSFFKIITKRSLYVLAAFLVVICFFLLASSNFFSLSAAERHLFTYEEKKVFYDSCFSVTRVIVIILTSVLSGLFISKSFNNSSEYMYLSGGVNRIQYIISKLISVVVLNVLIFTFMLIISSIIILSTDLGVIELIFVKIWIKLLLNSILVNSITILCITLFRNFFAGLFPVIIYFLYNSAYGAIIEKPEGTSLILFKIFNMIMPIFGNNNFNLTLDERSLYLTPYYGVGLSNICYTILDKILKNRIR